LAPIYTPPFPVPIERLKNNDDQSSCGFASERLFQTPLTRGAPCIALVGCDGAGKSTLAADLTKRLNRLAPTRSVYLGLGTGDLGRRIGQVPFLGPVVERFLSRKAKRAHDGTGKGLPDLATASVMFGFSLLRLRRFQKVLAYREHGIQVVTDRYPQSEVAGTFDGPSLAWTRKGSPLVEKLAARERALYEDMSACQPTLVIRLNVDADTALARKGDHERAQLERKLAVIPTLLFGGAPIVDIDATLPYHDVLATILKVAARYGLQGL
jgi:thymidylate kinase